MKTRIVLIGAGSSTFGLEVLGKIFQSSVLEGSEVVLHDIRAKSLSRVEKIARSYVEEKGLPYTLSATTSRREALPGADFCLISIEIGDRFALWEQDWKIPLQYGIRQVYAENGGPGGLFHSLRIIPPVLEICGDVSELCPRAHVISLSNPMTRICLAAKRKYPHLRFIGLCHEIASLQRHLPAILNTPFENLQIRAAGLNHFSVLLEARYRDTGSDAYPDIRAGAPAYFGNLESHTEHLLEEVYNPGDEYHPTPRKWPDRTLFREILEKFGYLPITEDSHFGEYIHWAHEVADHRGIYDFFEWYKKYCAARGVLEKIEPPPDWEWSILSIVEGILTDSGHEELAVNLPNEGLIDNLPRDMVVEVPAIVDKEGVHGIPLGMLPRGIAGLMRNHVATVDLTVEAALHGSKELALQALLVDPVVGSVRAAELALNDILDLQKQYLGYIC